MGGKPSSFLVSFPKHLPGFADDAEIYFIDNSHAYNYFQESLIKPNRYVIYDVRGKWVVVRHLSKVVPLLRFASQIFKLEKDVVLIFVRQTENIKFSIPYTFYLLIFWTSSCYPSRDSFSVLTVRNAKWAWAANCGVVELDLNAERKSLQEERMRADFCEALKRETLGKTVSANANFSTRNLSFFE